MSPGEVWDESQGLVLGAQLAALVVGEGLHILGQGLHVLTLVECQYILIFRVDETIVRELALSEQRFAVLQNAHDIEALVVWPLCTIYDRTTLDADAATVGLYLVVGTYGACLHVEVNANHIALLPLAVDGIIAILCYLSLYLLSVYGDGIAQTLAVAVVVKVRWNRLTLHPSRDADLHTELTSLVVIHLDGDISVPRVLCILAQGNLLAGHLQRRRVAEEEVNIYILILYGIYIAREGWQEAADVARAAGTAEPSLTLMLPHALQWVRVEEAAAVHTHTTDETIVEGTLQYIVILTLAMEEEESVVDINIADSCAGFAVGTHIRQLVVLAESLAVVGGSDTSGDVELLAHDVVPDAVDGVDIGSIAGEGCYICHTCIHIGGTYGMTYCFVLLQYWFVTL